MIPAKMNLKEFKSSGEIYVIPILPMAKPDPINEVVIITNTPYKYLFIT